MKIFFRTRNKVVDLCKYFKRSANELWACIHSLSKKNHANTVLDTDDTVMN